MLINLPHQSVPCIRGMRVQLVHDVILHECESIFVLTEHARALVRHDMLKANHENVGQVLRALHFWQKPCAEV